MHAVWPAGFGVAAVAAFSVGASRAAGAATRSSRPKVLLLTEKRFAPAAVAGIEEVCASAGYELTRCEGTVSRPDLLAAVADVDAMIIRSDLIDAEVLDAATNCKVVVRYLF